MGKIKLTDEVLNQILQNNYAEEVEQYFEAAIAGNIKTTSKDSLLKLLFLLVRYWEILTYIRINVRQVLCYSADDFDYNYIHFSCKANTMDFYV